MNFFKNPLSILLFYFLIPGCLPVFSQTKILCPGNKEVDSVIDMGIESAKTGNTKTAITLLEKGIALAKSSVCMKGELVANRNLMVLYSHMAEYEKSFEIAKEAEKLAFHLKDYKSVNMILTTKASLYDYLGLYNESLKEYESSLKYAGMIDDPDSRHYQMGFTYYNLAPYYQDTSLEKSGDYLKKARNEIEKIKDDSKEVSLNEKKDMIVSINMNLGIFYNNSENPKQNVQIAESYFTESLKDAENENYTIRNDTKIDLLDAITVFYNKQKNYKKAILYGEKMLSLEKGYSMPYNRKSAYRQLAESYLVTGENQTSQKYLKLYTKLNDSIILAEKKTVEKPISEIISKNEKQYFEKLKITVLTAAALLLCSGFIVFLLWKKRKKELHERYESLIHNLKSGIQEPEPVEKASSKNLKQVQITDETVASLLKKLERFERSNKFTRQDINFAYLANYLGTNSKYLNEILKQYKEKTFTQYINDLRIDYIIKLLYDEPKYREYKISYLAEISGFSTRNIFATIFKKKTGMNPSYFIEKLNESGEHGE